METGIQHAAARACAQSHDTLTLDAAILERATDTFAGIEPWCGFAPKGRARNFLGAVAPDERDSRPEPDFEEIEFRQTVLPEPNGGEAYLELYSMVSSVKDARERYVAVSLGAHDGRPLVNAALAVRRINPMNFKLVGVEGDHHMGQKLRRHFRNNRIDPDDHAIINAVVSDTNRPVIFPTTEVRTGANFAFHGSEMVESLFEVIRDAELCERVLENLLRTRSTGLRMPPGGTGGVEAELEMVSALTVADILSPFDRVDYLEIDIQASEAIALPPAQDTLAKTVRWLHLGTHGIALHRAMAAMFLKWGWEILAEVLPESRYETPSGPFSTQDGVVVARNPRV